MFAQALYLFVQKAKQQNSTSTALKKIRQLIKALSESEFGARKYTDGIIGQVIFSTYDAFCFEVVKSLMVFDFAESRKTYENLLESIGTEESYQRCCENDHETENIFYTMYETVKAKMQGRSYSGYELFSKAKGKTIEQIIYFGETADIRKKSDFTEFCADIGFLMGDTLVRLTNYINIFCIPAEDAESPYVTVPDFFGADIVGRTITDISFSHKTVSKEYKAYSQPTVSISLDNGIILNFTHNFGEAYDGVLQPRFYITKLDEVV